jgi:hypothetical protein
MGLFFLLQLRELFADRMDNLHFLQKSGLPGQGIPFRRLEITDGEMTQYRKERDHAQDQKPEDAN